MSTNPYHQRSSHTKTADPYSLSRRASPKRASPRTPKASACSHSTTAPRIQISSYPLASSCTRFFRRSKYRFRTLFCDFSTENKKLIFFFFFFFTIHCHQTLRNRNMQTIILQIGIRNHFVKAKPRLQRKRSIVIFLFVLFITIRVE